MSEIMDEIRQRAAEGDQGCIDWLEHQGSKHQLRDLAKFIKDDPRLKDEG